MRELTQYIVGRLRQRAWVIILVLVLGACASTESPEQISNQVGQPSSQAIDSVPAVEALPPTTTTDAADSPTPFTGAADDKSEPAATDGAPARVEVDTPAVTVESTLEPEALRARYDAYEIVTLLPRDAIPSIDDPEFMNVEEADTVYDPEEFVMGVDFNGDSRAYSVGLLSRHEIVNDNVAGVKIAVTW